jgi:hypothetical protein
VIKLNQPYGRLAKNLLEKQNYPDPRLRTYDDSGWSMGYAFGVDVVQVDSASILNAPVTPVTEVRLAGSTKGTGTAALAVAHYGSNNMISLRYKLKDVSMRVAEKSFTADGVEFPAGSFIITDMAAADRVKAAVAELGLTAAALGTAPVVATHDAVVPRVAIYTQWSGTQSLGWYRLTFDKFGVPFELIYKERVAQGNLKNDQPVNADNKMMLPGTSRNTFLTQYTTREDAAAKDFWADGLHSKSHHQQYTDFIKSSKHRNGNHLVACADCHEPHGKAKFAHQMKLDSNSAESCTTCHKGSTDMAKHMMDKTKCNVAPEKITCVSCHSTKTAQTGAGMGKGMTGKDGKNYWMNDISSHLYDVPRKDNVGVKGVEPGKAMPIPYTHSCGTGCHNTSAL